MPDYTPYDIRNMAHARLITAAPDLLKVCEELVESSQEWGEYDGPLCLVGRAKAAIAKAKGALS